MTDFELRRVENRKERDLITFLIVSDQICHEILQHVKAEHIKSKYGKRILVWVKEYWLKYQEAPKRNIETIFAVNKEDIRQDEADLIEEFLLNLSTEYEKLQDLNQVYVLQELKEYVGTRILEISIEKAENFLEAGELENAKNCFSNSLDFPHEFMYDVYRPLTLKQVVRHYRQIDSTNMFNFSGVIGDLIGTFQYGWFVGVLAPMKRGKSWLLLEAGVQSVLNSHNTLFISLEMNKKDIEDRIYRRFTSSSPRAGEHLYPIFDCEENQKGTCERKERKNKITLIADDRNKPEFSDSFKYKVCTACRGTNYSNLFKPASWFTKIKRPALNASSVKKKIKQFESMYGGKLMIQVFPRFGATVKDIETLVDYLRINENYIPSTIIIDYADILRPEHREGDERAQTDSVYKRLGGMAMKYKSLVITASQSTRRSISKNSLSQEDIAEDIRKLAHLDVLIGLNQTLDEKKDKTMRLNIIGHRHRDFDPRLQAFCLTNFNTGAVIIDSEKVYF